MKKLGIWISILLMLAMSVPVKASAAQAQEVRIPVTVLAEGAAPDAVYTVELIPQTEGCPMPEGSANDVYRMNLHGGSGTIRIPCDTLGVFDYLIRQVPGSAENCDYDDSIYRLRLFVTAAEDGSTVTTALIYGQEETKEPSALFRNYWAKPVYVAFTALKTMDGKTPEDGAFTFRLLSETGEVLYEVENQGRNIVFPALTFDRVGTYRYFLKEVAGTDGKILYDRTVYTITVDVTLDGDYRAAITYERNGKPYSGIPTFRNYTDTGLPKTGDTIGSAFTVMILSAVGLAALFVFRRRKQ